jgi:hypothetical protein
LFRLERNGALDEAAVIEAFERLKRLADGWHEVDPSDGFREVAVCFLRVHSLRAVDALHAHVPRAAWRIERTASLPADPTIRELTITIAFTVL